MPNGDTTPDVAGPARTLIRWLLTIGAALVYVILVLQVCLDVWSGNDDVVVDTIVGGVMNSLALTFGSAFVGWFGITSQQATVRIAADVEHRRVAIAGQLLTTLAGAAVFAMLIYLAGGAFAGVTYLFNQDETPTVLITVATAWAAQASAVVAATLTKVLRPEEE